MTRLWGGLAALNYLCAVGDLSGMGALRSRNTHGAFEGPVPAVRRGKPPLLVLEKMLSASLAAELDRDTAKDLAYLRGMATSLGGMFPK